MTALEMLLPRKASAQHSSRQVKPQQQQQGVRGRQGALLWTAATVGLVALTCAWWLSHVPDGSHMCRSFPNTAAALPFILVPVVGTDAIQH